MGASNLGTLSTADRDGSRRMSRPCAWSIALVVTVSIALVNATEVSACSCAPGPSLQVALEQSPLVFVGTVRAISKSPPTNLEGRRAFNLDNEVEFEVERVFKGDDRDRVTVLTSSSTPACGFPFESGIRYLVYTFQRDDSLPGVSLCGETKAAHESEDELRALAELVDRSPVETRSDTASGLTSEPSKRNSPPPSRVRQTKRGCACGLAPVDQRGGAAWLLGGVAFLLLLLLRRRHDQRSNQ